MKTNKLYSTVYKVISLALFFIVLVPNLSLAAATDIVPTTLPTYCDPLPEDPALLQDCVDYWGSNGQIGIYDDTPTPINGPGAGVNGMSGAYNPNNDTLLFVSTTAYGTAIVGQMYKASTLEPQGQSFNIDQSNLYVKTPKAIYNSVTDTFFVVWQDERPYRERSSIYGRFVGANGALPANDFAIYNSRNVAIGDLTIDYTNQRYVISYDQAPDGPRVVFVSFAGVASEPVNLDQTARLYEGQTSVAYNSTLNQYWYAYTLVVSGDNTSSEDIRIMMARVDAASLEKVGDPIQLSATRVGRNNFSSPQIAYSPVDKAAMVVWQEGGRTPGMVSEVYGRTIYDNLTLSPEHRILTGGGAYSTSDFYGAPDVLTYNSATNSYAIAVQDNNYATTAVQFDSTGYVSPPREVIAQQDNSGNYNPTTIATGKSFVTPTSAGNNQTKITTMPSDFSGSASGSTNAGGNPEAAGDFSINSAEFSKAVSKWYIYALGVAALLAIAMTVFGGYLVMSARGNAQQAAKGKDFLFSSLIGLLLLMSAFILLNTINPQLTQFKLPSSFITNPPANPAP